MFRITSMDKTEANIDILSHARKKFEKCGNHDVSFDQMTCKLYMYTMDTNMDILHHCGSCKINTDEPTTFKPNVRSR